jgi:nitrogen fixation NifU-like protein
MYSKKVIEYFNHPKNMGKIDCPDGVGKVGNIICGDVMHLYIKVDKNDVIEDIKYETFGCVAAISSSSMITEMVKGKTIVEALKIEKSSIIDSLEGLPKAKIHCSVLAIDALSESIYDYLKKNKRDIPDFLEKKHNVIVKNLK